MVYTDMETCFPRSQHGVLDVSAFFVGVPSDVRELPLREEPAATGPSFVTHLLHGSFATPSVESLHRKTDHLDPL